MQCLTAEQLLFSFSISLVSRFFACGSFYSLKQLASTRANRNSLTAFDLPIKFWIFVLKLCARLPSASPILHRQWFNQQRPQQKQPQQPFIQFELNSICILLEFTRWIQRGSLYRWPQQNRRFYALTHTRARARSRTCIDRDTRKWRKEKATKRSNTHNKCARRTLKNTQTNVKQAKT